MRKPGGYAFIVDPDGGRVNYDHVRYEHIGAGITESDTFTCAHCNCVRHAPVAKRDTDYFFCRNCMARICEHCADYGCTPFEKKLEWWEARDRALRSYGL